MTQRAGVLIAAALLAALGPFGGRLCFAQSAAAEREIVEADKPVEVDGKLDEWTGVSELAVDRTPEGKTVLPSSDLTVGARLMFDAEYLYAGVKVADSELTFPERGLREGDSLFLTLVDLGPDSRGTRYSTWGFAHSRSEDIKILVSRNGRAYPQAFVKDILVKVEPAADRKSLVYEIAIPWRYVPDFRPFMGQVWGINLACVDYDQKVRKTVELVPEEGAEEDLTAPRRGLAFRFVPRVPRTPEFQTMLSANRFFPQDRKTLELAVNSPAARSGWSLRFQLSSADGNVQTKKTLSFGPGLSIISFPLEIPKPETGLYDFSVGVLDDKASLRFSEDKQFYLLARPDISSLAAGIGEIKKSEAYAKDEVLRQSLPTLEIRLKWTEDFMKAAGAYGDIESLERWSEEIKELMRYVEAGKPALFPTGRAVTLGYISPVDGTLKSYAVFVPEWYDRKLRFPLYVTLGEAGADAERNVSLIQTANGGPGTGRRAGDMIILGAPSALAVNWYSGDAGREILACIDHVKKLYSINDKAIILDGFDRGAYGALRLALLNPGLFEGVVLRSGRYVPPESVQAGEISGLFAAARGLRALVVHGDKDDIAPVAEARSVADQLLKAAGPAVKLIEDKEGEHLMIDRWPDVLAWVRNVLGDAVVKVKPPRKPGNKRGQENPEDPGTDRQLFHDRPFLGARGPSEPESIPRVENLRDNP